MATVEQRAEAHAKTVIAELVAELDDLHACDAGLDARRLSRLAIERKLASAFYVGWHANAEANRGRR